MITDDNLAWMTEIMARELGTVEEDRCIVVLPVFHALAKMAGLWGPFYVGATVYLEERFIPDAILEMIEREKITIFTGVPTMFTFFAHSPRLKDFDYSSLRIFGSGGASIPVEIIDRIRNEIGVEIAEAYGQTEATIMITAMPLGAEKVPGSVGQPVDGDRLPYRDTGQQRCTTRGNRRNNFPWTQCDERLLQKSRSNSKYDY